VIDSLTTLSGENRINQVKRKCTQPPEDSQEPFSGPNASSAFHSSGYNGLIDTRSLPVIILLLSCVFSPPLLLQILTLRLQILNLRLENTSATVELPVRL
jgi:hypothetical protein